MRHDSRRVLRARRHASALPSAPRPPWSRTWLAVLIVLIFGGLAFPGTTSAEEVTSGGWTTSAEATATVVQGDPVNLTALVTASSAGSALIDLEVHGPSGQKVFQRYWAEAWFAAGQQRQFNTTWKVPVDAEPGEYVVKIGIFSLFWRSLRHWNNRADAVEVRPSTTPTTATTTTTTASSPTTTTTNQPATTTTAAAPPSSSADLFFEDFSGDTGLESFRTGIFHRERDVWGRADWVSTDPWPASHNIHLSDCGDPNTNHHNVSTAQGDSASFFVCREHMMTTMGDVSGYSVVWFSPRYQGPISEVCWDASVSRDIMGERQWWEVMVAPVNAPDVTAIDWLAPTANLPSYGDAGAVIFGFGPDAVVHPKISVGDNEPVRHAWPDSPAWGDAFRNQAVRIPHCFRDLGDGNLEYETVNADGTTWSFTAPGSFPDGALKVVFKDHSYTPTKACGDAPCANYTWHWDNIRLD